MEICLIESMKPKIEDKTTRHICFGCSAVYGDPLITETDCAKISLRSANVKKNPKNFVLITKEPLTVHSKHWIGLLNAP